MKATVSIIKFSFGLLLFETRDVRMEQGLTSAVSHVVPELPVLKECCKTCKSITKHQFLKARRKESIESHRDCTNVLNLVYLQEAIKYLGINDDSNQLNVI